MSSILNDTELAELLAGSSQHGEYDQALKKFVDSNEKGIEVSLTSGPFTGKKVASVKSGFVNAVGRAGQRKADGTYKAPPLPDGVIVAVIAKNDKVYVIRRDLVVPQPAAPAAEAPATTETAAA